MLKQVSSPYTQLEVLQAGKFYELNFHYHVASLTTKSVKFTYHKKFRVYVKQLVVGGCMYISDFCDEVNVHMYFLYIHLYNGIVKVTIPSTVLCIYVCICLYIYACMALSFFMTSILFSDQCYIHASVFTSSQ